ncbi:MAG: NAD(P)/FAD-dependent oxidoreductase [Ignavibacteria bacterium]|nr:NAD(P)/FAD-dependent oxidoreductase [Ignavibacteria bacterium]
MTDTQITIIGAGVVGLAIAARLSTTSRNIVLLEKNVNYGMETSSRNSEVIHAGIYYTPGSLKALLCIEGRDELYSMCRAHDIPHKKLTKIITASDESDLPKLNTIYENGCKNGVELRMLSGAEALAMEPNIRSAGAIFSPLTGIISAHALMDRFYWEASNNGVTIQHRAEVIAIEPQPDGFTLTIREGEDRSQFSSEWVINCAGLYSDVVAEMVGIDVDAEHLRLHYAKGSYFSVTPSKAGIVSRLIYPVPRNEGLGVHALIDWGGRLKFGPDVEFIDRRSIQYDVSEEKRKPFGESIRRIVPGITDDDLAPDMSGVRPKLQDKGGPVRDFVIRHEKERGLEGFVNLIGIESPGLTASPAIARYVEKLLD